MRVTWHLLGLLLFGAIASAQVKKARKVKSWRSSLPSVAKRAPRVCDVQEGGACRGPPCCDKSISPRIYCYKRTGACTTVADIRADRRRRKAARKGRTAKRPRSDRKQRPVGPARKGPLLSQRPLGPEVIEQRPLGLSLSSGGAISQRPVSGGRELRPEDCALGPGKECQSSRGKTFAAYCACAEGLTCQRTGDFDDFGRPLKRCLEDRSSQRPLAGPSNSAGRSGQLEIESCRLGLDKGPCKGRGKTMGSFCACGDGLQCQDLADSSSRKKDWKCVWDDVTPKRRVQQETEYTYARAGEDSQGNPAPIVQRPLASFPEDLAFQPQMPIRQMPMGGSSASSWTTIKSCTLGLSAECEGHRGKTMATYCSGCGRGLVCADVERETRRWRGKDEPMRRCEVDPDSEVPPQRRQENVYTDGTRDEPSSPDQ